MEAEPDERPELGVEVAGFLRSGLGLGEAARLYVTALQAAGLPVHTTTVDVRMPHVVDRHGQAARKKRVEFEDLEHAGDRPFSLICVNAPELPAFRAEVGDSFFDRPRNIGSWAWEVDKVPAEWAPMFGMVDEIWVYSNYIAENLAEASPVPVMRVPLPILEPRIEMSAPDLGLPDTFTFLFLFDFFSTLKRKNPVGLITAFRRAFAPGEGPQLLLKAFNGDYKPQRLAEVVRAAGDHPDIHVVDQYLSGAEKDALIAACDCYVSLHRAEGFGLTLGEAMVLGKPVIATNYSGNTDFMAAETSYLVDWTLTEVGLGGENYPPEGRWAEPDVDHAAALMRQVWENQEAARAIGASAAEEIRANWSADAVGAVARARLELLASSPATRRERAPASRALPRPPGALERSELKRSYDPERDAAAAGGVRGALRRAALRAMRPHTHHQAELNALVVRSIRETSDRLDELTLETHARGNRADEDLRALMERVAAQQLSLDAHELAFDEAGLDEAGRIDLVRMLLGMRARPGGDHAAITRRSRGRMSLAFDKGDDNVDGEVDFEGIFRGSQELIRERQRHYLAHFRTSGHVVDLGCGRGEFLDLLREADIPATGVDLDPEMVRQCRAKGHDAVEADAIAYLEGIEPRSADGLFAAQVIEHLPHAALKRFLSLAEERLKPGGTAIFETVNPHCPSAMKAFWTDPTHQHPLFPEVALGLARIAGFHAGRVHFPNGAGIFDEDVYTVPDYAVILTATPAPAEPGS